MAWLAEFEFSRIKRTKIICPIGFIEKENLTTDYYPHDNCGTKWLFEDGSYLIVLRSIHGTNGELKWSRPTGESLDIDLAEYEEKPEGYWN